LFSPSQMVFVAGYLNSPRTLSGYLPIFDADTLQG
jgi:hypothetical protein